MQSALTRFFVLLVGCVALQTTAFAQDAVVKFDLSSYSFDGSHSSVDLVLTNAGSVGGYQIQLPSSVSLTSVSGGTTGAAGFRRSYASLPSGEVMIVASHRDGTLIPAGNTSLTRITFSSPDTSICLSSPVFVDGVGVHMTSQADDCLSIPRAGCMDMDALNYDEYAEYDYGCIYQDTLTLSLRNLDTNTGYAEVWFESDGSDPIGNFFLRFDGIDQVLGVGSPSEASAAAYDQLALADTLTGKRTGAAIMVPSLGPPRAILVRPQFDLYKPQTCLIEAEIINAANGEPFTITGDPAQAQPGAIVCIDSIIEGCTDPVGLNYNPEANSDTGCTYSGGGDADVTLSLVSQSGSDVVLDIVLTSTEDISSFDLALLGIEVTSVTGGDAVDISNFDISATVDDTGQPPYTVISATNPDTDLPAGSDIALLTIEGTLGPNIALDRALWEGLFPDPGPAIWTAVTLEHARHPIMIGGAAFSSTLAGALTTKPGHFVIANQPPSACAGPVFGGYQALNQIPLPMALVPGDRFDLCGIPDQSPSVIEWLTVDVLGGPTRSAVVAKLFATQDSGPSQPTVICG
ncbi:MAG: hypothetical protein KC561_04680, partial [Myxococcales bacterium]|nr:hypothetical protein [Myxococcales bacterium]